MAAAMASPTAVSAASARADSPLASPVSTKSVTSRSHWPASSLLRSSS